MAPDLTSKGHSCVDPRIATLLHWILSFCHWNRHSWPDFESVRTISGKEGVFENLAADEKETTVIGLSW